MRVIRFVLVFSIFVLGCPDTSCPDGQVAVEGACYPEAAVVAVGGGVPLLCRAPCSGETPICDYRTGTCIGCLEDADCNHVGATRCDRVTRLCVECLGDDDCPREDAPVCDRDVDRCVGCVDGADCSDRTLARCDDTTATCAGCASHADCARFADTPSCDVETGECVACTPDTESIRCLGNSCDAIAHVCTSTPVRSVGACHACRSDSECAPNLRCTSFSGVRLAPAESVCLWDATDHGCATSPTHPRAPYSRVHQTTTLTGDPVTVCAPRSTCYATLAYIAQKPCTSFGDCTNYVRGAGMCLEATATEPAHCTTTCLGTLDPTGDYDGCLYGDTCGGIICQSD